MGMTVDVGRAVVWLFWMRVDRNGHSGYSGGSHN